MDFFSSQIRCSVGYLRKGITYKVCHEEGISQFTYLGRNALTGETDKEQQDFKVVARTKNKTLQNLKHSLSQNNTSQNLKTSTKVHARLLKFDEFFFCKTTLHHSEKFQGIPSIYLINLKIMKHCQVFSYLSGQWENFQINF